MNDLEYVKSILKTEKCLLVIKKKSEIGFWDYQMLGLFSFLTRKEKDYLVITEKRIIYVIKNELIKDEEYYKFSKIKFNHFNDTINFVNAENEPCSINIKEFRITYEEIQKLKEILN